MAKKKGVKKKASKKRNTKKNIPKQVPKSKRISIILNNLIFFGVLFIASFSLYFASSTEMYINLFGILSIAFGFLSFALLILLISLLFLKFIQKNK